MRMCVDEAAVWHHSRHKVGSTATVATHVHPRPLWRMQARWWLWTVAGEPVGCIVPAAHAHVHFVPDILANFASAAAGALFEHKYK